MSYQKTNKFLLLGTAWSLISNKSSLVPLEQTKTFWLHLTVPTEKTFDFEVVIKGGTSRLLLARPLMQKWHNKCGELTRIAKGKSSQSHHCIPRVWFGVSGFSKGHSTKGIDIFGTTGLLHAQFIIDNAWWHQESIVGEHFHLAELATAHHYKTKVPVDLSPNNQPPPWNTE